MRVLFLHKNHPCYLGESLCHGLRTQLGKDCVDVPKYDSLYAPLSDALKATLRGNGFTLYGLLTDVPELGDARRRWRQDLQTYDFIVLAHPWEQGDLLRELSRSVAPQKIILVDGTDGPIFFPYGWSAWNLYKHPSWYFTKTSQMKYFKRELTGDGAAYNLDRFLPRFIRKRMGPPAYARPISFSIPAEKIHRVAPEEKIKEFPTHVVDPEVAAQTPGSFFSSVGENKHAFSNENDYYADLRKSRFGITTRRAGWDCMRHYELASQGCVLCFRDLDLKPATCAPHGLNGSNCLIYHSYEDLQAQIKGLASTAYAALQDKTYDWVNENTTVQRARQFLDACRQTV